MGDQMSDDRDDSDFGRVHRLVMACEFDAAAALAMELELSPDQRAMIAAYMVGVVRDQAQTQAGIRRAWIARARLTFDPGPRQPCAICARYQSVTQAHHRFPLALQCDAGLVEPIHDSDWLCPTHHAAMHVIIDALIANRQPHLDGFPPAETDAMNALAVEFVALWAREWL